VSVGPNPVMARFLSSSELTFQINGTNVGTFSNAASAGSDTEFIYNTPVFVKEGLPLGRHALSILNSGGSSKSLLLLDRIIYIYVGQLLPFCFVTVTKGHFFPRRAVMGPKTFPNPPATYLALFHPRLPRLSIHLIHPQVPRPVRIPCPRQQRRLQPKIRERADAHEGSPPEYGSVVLEVTEPAVPTLLNSFGHAGTKELMARLAGTHGDGATRPPQGY